MRILYNNEEHSLILNSGTCWRDPPEGTKFVTSEDGLEYDITNYIEDEGWLIRSIKTDKESFVYKSECKII